MQQLGRDGFQQLIDRYFSSIYRFAFRSLRDHSLAEDSCQEVFLKAWKSRQKFDNSSAARFWLFAVARTTIADVFRRRAKLKYMPSKDVEFAGQVRCSNPDSATGIANDDLAEGLASLPEQTRTVVTLRVFDEMKCVEIAKLLGVSPATVSRRLYEGLTALRSVVSNRS